MKAILVLDKMPNSCEECEVRCDGYTAKEYAEKSIKRPSWCPVKPMPEKENTAFNGYNSYIMHYEEGWNDCIGTILGEFDIEDGETE